MNWVAIRALVLAGLLVVGEEAKAQTYNLIGSGAISCGSWTAHRRAYNPGGPITSASQSGLEDIAWVLGFLSGIGFVGSNGANPLNGIDAEGVGAWVDNYCRDHPLDKIAVAAGAFYRAHPR